jgi:signal transduction histidine kinase/HAMP domain-containing protein
MAQRVALENAVPMLGMMFVLALVGYGFLRLVMRMITSSIQVLVEDSERISQGDLDHALALTGEDEVGQLGQSMEQMRVNLKARMEEINRLLFVSRGVAEAMEIEVAVNPILEGALATGASSARLVLAPTAVTEFEHDAQTQFGMGPSSEKYQPLDMEVLKLTERQQVVILTNPRRAGLKDRKDMPAAFMAVALRHENEHFGALWLAYDKPHKFTDDEQRFLTAVGGQAALAASNARLFLSGQLGKQRLEAVLASTPGPVLVTDHQDRLLLANPAALALLSEEGQEPISGTPVETFIKQKELLDLLVGDEAGHVEVTFPEKRVFYASVSPVITEGQVMGKVCVLSEITHFKELDALKSEFVATVSHDLRSPLTLVRGYATMMQMVGDLNEQQMDYIKKIVTGVESMSKMVNNLLDLGRIETGVGLRLEMVPVTDIVTQVTEAMRLQAVHKQVSIGVEMPDYTIPLVEADQTLLYQALQNLVDNAIRYTRAEGRVTVGVKQAGGKAIFEVKDTGIGISPVDLPRVFERFYRVESRGPKTSENRGGGLGLTIVKSIAQRHGGDAWGESTLGKGSVFRMSIPVRQPKEE